MPVRIKKAVFMLLEMFLRFAIVPSWRAVLLRLFGARVGNNVRIYEINIFNLSKGFSNLTIEDDVHIGNGVCIDLEGQVVIEKGATLSPGVTIITHSDPGSYHHSPLCAEFTPFVAAVRIGAYCWIGVNSTILAGTHIHHNSVLGACSLAKDDIEPESLYAGIPAKKVRKIELPSERQR